MRALTLCAVLLAASASSAWAQRSTEQFIPVGESPGVSKSLSYQGRIDGADARSKTVTIQSVDGSMLTVRIGTRTRMWLDRSRIQLPNISAQPSDLQAGRRIEVRFIDPARRDTVDWIKIVVESGG
jgi:hypothetical protein